MIAAVVAARVVPADVVAHDDQDVRLLAAGGLDGKQRQDRRRRVGLGERWVGRTSLGGAVGVAADVKLAGPSHPAEQGADRERRRCGKTHSCSHDATSENGEGPRTGRGPARRAAAEERQRGYVKRTRPNTRERATGILPEGTVSDIGARYQWGGSCWYTGGFHAAGLLAPAAGVIPCVPAYLATVGLVEVMPSWTDLYHSAWSLGFGTSLLVYSGLTLRRPGGIALPRGS